MKLNIDIHGLPELKKKLGDTNFRVAMKQGMTKAVIYFEGEIKKRIPVKSGRLRSSFTHKVSHDGEEGIVGTNILYGPFVEFGTGVYVGKGRIYPKSAGALAWDGMVRHSIAGMKGSFYVKRAWQEEGGGKLIRFFRDSFVEALRRKV